MEALHFANLTRSACLITEKQKANGLDLADNADTKKGSSGYQLKPTFSDNSSPKTPT